MVGKLAQEDRNATNHSSIVCGDHTGGETNVVGKLAQEDRNATNHSSIVCGDHTRGETNKQHSVTMWQLCESSHHLLVTNSERKNDIGTGADKWKVDRMSHDHKTSTQKVIRSNCCRTLDPAMYKKRQKTFTLIHTAARVTQLMNFPIAKIHITFISTVPQVTPHNSIP